MKHLQNVLHFFLVYALLHFLNALGSIILRRELSCFFLFFCFFFFSKKCEKSSTRVHLKFKFFRKKAIKENIALSLS